MGAIHQYIRRTCLEFITFPQGRSDGTQTAIRLSDVAAEEHPEGAHAAQCTWRPSQTVGEETANAALSAGFVFSTPDLMPAPAPVIRRSFGPSTTVTRLRGIEMRLQNLEAAGVTAPVTVTATISWDTGLTTVCSVQVAKGGDVSTACLTFPPGKVADGIGFYIQNPNLKKAEFTILAIGDAAPEPEE